MNHRLSVHSQNNGGHNISKIAAEQSFNYKRKVEQAYKYAFDVAASKGADSIKAKISDDMQTALNEAESFESSHQLVRLNVNASRHGNILDRKRGWSHVSVDILVKCVVPANLEQQLMTKYALR